MKCEVLHVGVFQKTTISWNVKQRALFEVYWNFKGNFCFHGQDRWGFVTKLLSLSSSETSAYFYQTTRRYVAIISSLDICLPCFDYMSCALLSNQLRITTVSWVQLTSLRGRDKPREQNTVSFRKRQPRVALKKRRKNVLWGSERQHRGKTLSDAREGSGWSFCVTRNSP
jgi:hypothetical protein